MEVNCTEGKYAEGSYTEDSYTEEIENEWEDDDVDYSDYSEIPDEVYLQQIQEEEVIEEECYEEDGIDVISKNIASRELVCKRSYLGVLGSLMIDPNLITDTNRPLNEIDFDTDPFYRILYVSLYNLNVGQKKIDEFAVDTYLSKYPKLHQIFIDNDGITYLSEAKNIATNSLDSYDYYYHRLRKYSLLRYFENHGVDVTSLYNYKVVDPMAFEKEQRKFDEMKEDEMLRHFEGMTISARQLFCSNTLSTKARAGDGMMELLHDLKKKPDYGLGFNSNAFFTVTRGARKGCLFMRSAGTGGSKTRQSFADACKIGVGTFYNIEEGKWEETGWNVPTLFISTEVEIPRMQTLIAAIISGVDEDHINEGRYEDGEWERIIRAVQYIESSNLHLEHMPDFDIEDIKNTCKFYRREYGVEYVFFDYIHTSLKLMSQITKASGIKMREDQMLVVFITEMKNLCQELGIFMMTGSQLSGDFEGATYKDQQLLAGAKALANKLDVGVICTRPNRIEKKKIEACTRKMVDVTNKINMLTWIYKVRGTKLTKLIIHSHYDLSNMRVKDYYVTDYDFNLVDVEFITPIPDGSAVIVPYDGEEDVIEKIIDDNSISAHMVQEAPTDTVFDIGKCADYDVNDEEDNEKKEGTEGMEGIVNSITTPSTFSSSTTSSPRW